MNFEETYPDTCSTAYQAAKAGNLQALEQCIAEGKPVDVKDNRGWMSFHVAAFYGHIDCLHLLLKQDCTDVNATTFERETALLWACTAGQPACVSALLDAGANPNLATLEDFTPLFKASQKCLKCVEAVLKAGAYINDKIYTGDSALHNAVKHRRADIVKCLLENNADMSIQDDLGLTPLFVGSNHGVLDCVQLLLKQAAEQGEFFVQMYVNMEADDKATSLYIAAQEGYDDCVKLLLKYGADPDAHVPIVPDSDLTITPLQIALDQGRIECVQQLIEVTSIEQFKWQNFNDDNLLYHPLILVMKLDSHKPLTQLLKKDRIIELCTRCEELSRMPVLFNTNLSVVPAVIFAKTFYKQLKWNNVWKMFKYASIHQEDYEPEDEASGLMIYLLRLRLREDVSHYNESVLSLSFWAAKLKYTMARNCCVEDTNTGERKFCAEKINTAKDISPVTTEENLNLQIIKELMSTRAQMADEIIGRTEDIYFTPRLRPAVSGSLQHLCRRSIALNLVCNGCYTLQSVSSLQLPDSVQQYIMYEQSEEWKNFMIACDEMEMGEAKLNKYLDKYDTEQVIPRSAYQVYR